MAPDPPPRGAPPPRARAAVARGSACREPGAPHAASLEPRTLRGAPPPRALSAVARGPRAARGSAGEGGHCPGGEPPRAAGAAGEGRSAGLGEKGERKSE
jgi:hypothetical protein